MQGRDDTDQTADIVVGLLSLAPIVLMLAALWKVFEKAGEAGWAAIVPFYNLYVMIRMAGRPGWWFILILIPLVNLIPAILLPIDIAKRFGKGTLFGVGLVFLPFIFDPILAFGNAEFGHGKRKRTPYDPTAKPAPPYYEV